MGGAGRECHVERVLRDHDAEIGSLAWSWDGSTLLSSAEKTVKLWNVKVCSCAVCALVGFSILTDALSWDCTDRCV